MSQQAWENSFLDLDKNLFSADAVQGYDVMSTVKSLITEQSFILDYGCGKGQMIKKFRELGYVHSYGVDPSVVLLDSSDTNRLYPDSLKKLAGAEPPFPKKYFDLIYCSGVLHHIERMHYPQIFKEIHDSLKPNAYFVYLEPRKSWARHLGHILVFSPLHFLVKQVATLRACLIAEWPTYKVWLDQESEAMTDIEAAGFKLIEHQRKLLTSVAIFQVSR
jgi:SAM-dependent methyltransferase